MTESSESTWYETARLELSEHEGVDVDIVSHHGSPFFYSMESSSGEGESGESEWIVFENEDEAEIYAVNMVKEQLEESPGDFDENWLRNFLFVDDSTAHEIAFEEASSRLDVSDEDILEQAHLRGDWNDLQDLIDKAELDLSDLESGEWDGDGSNVERLNAEIEKLTIQQEKLVYDAREIVSDSVVEEILRSLKDDPIGYVEELGHFEGEPLPKWITVDIDAAAQNAIDVDGVDHFLDMYNGYAIRLKSGAVAYGQN